MDSSCLKEESQEERALIGLGEDKARRSSKAKDEERKTNEKTEDDRQKGDKDEKRGRNTFRGEREIRAIMAPIGEAALEVVEDPEDSAAVFEVTGIEHEDGIVARAERDTSSVSLATILLGI